MNNNIHQVCRYVRHYRAKNGYAPTREDVGCDSAFFDLLVEGGVLEVLPLYEGGPPIGVVLTDKGLRVAER